jgi:hypothetical protein
MKKKIQNPNPPKDCTNTLVCGDCKIGKSLNCLSLGAQKIGPKGGTDGPLSGRTCSDGATGLETRWGYSATSPLKGKCTDLEGNKTVCGWAAYNLNYWGSPCCGACIKLTEKGGNFVYVTLIDSMNPGKSVEDFDLDDETFSHLNNGQSTGQVDLSTAMVVNYKNCLGNKGGGTDKSGACCNNDGTTSCPTK